MHRFVRVAVAGVAASVLVLSGCADTEDTAETTTTAAEPTTTEAPTTTESTGPVDVELVEVGTDPASTEDYCVLVTSMYEVFAEQPSTPDEVTVVVDALNSLRAQAPADIAMSVEGVTDGLGEVVAIVAEDPSVPFDPSNMSLQLNSDGFEASERELEAWEAINCPTADPSGGEG